MPYYTVPISIVMPCFNAEPHVNEAIESILRQTFGDFELIIVDDGSKDRTLDVVLGFDDRRVKLLKHGRNLGNYPARNSGIKAASGKYIAMMDADDVALPNRLEVQHAFLERYRHVGAIGSAYRFIDPQGRAFRDITGPMDYSNFKIALLQNNMMLQSSIMIRHHLIKKHGLLYDTRYRYAADYDFVWRCSTAFPIFNLREKLLMYRVHPNQISSNYSSEQRRYAEEIRAKQFSRLGVRIPSEAMDLINRMMAYGVLTEDELQAVLHVFGNVLEFNRINRVYASNILYRFLQSALDQAVLRSTVIDRKRLEDDLDAECQMHC